VRALAARLRASVEGLAPERIALLLSVGLVLGVFPIAGCPTVLCLLAALGLRLNATALQALNNLSSPLQLALLLPLNQAGVCLCGGALPSGGSAAGRIGIAALHAIAGWGCICVPAGVLLYFGLILALKRQRAARPSVRYSRSASASRPCARRARPSFRWASAAVGSLPSGSCAR